MLIPVLQRSKVLVMFDVAEGWPKL